MGFRLLEYKIEELNGKKITDIIVENNESTISV
jgi:hypothetical protein